MSFVCGYHLRGRFDKFMIFSLKQYFFQNILLFSEFDSKPIESGFGSSALIARKSSAASLILYNIREVIPLSNGMNPKLTRIFHLVNGEHLYKFVFVLLIGE